MSSHACLAAQVTCQIVRQLAVRRSSCQLLMACSLLNPCRSSHKLYASVLSAPHCRHLQEPLPAHPGCNPQQPYTRSDHAAAAKTWAGVGQPLLQRGSSLPDPALFDQAAFVPPGYGSLLFAHLYENNTCPLSFPGSVFTAFRAWVRDSLQLPLQGALPVQGQSLKVLPGLRVWIRGEGAELDTFLSDMAAQWLCTRSSCPWMLGLRD